jgi:hypothetical protein
MFRVHFRLGLHFTRDTSERSIARRRKEFGLLGSGKTTEMLSEPVKKQLVLDQLAKDPLGNHGPRTVKEGIAFDTGIHLTRCVVEFTVRYSH